ncbi:hypothetical protein TVAG_052930 [Trichomonas vaginalis G3]|uniref:Uncharacterized protein n=1 Tax=Trichomonas vaginalis (strain ATCC PRA-98 / G3) TaxID=412133 RepID=A2F6K5_TRIV3|nr:guanylate cyclase protein [Trichomonas vaginalis G3]EAX99450.1 hypothetical protein TVAG_052930 [Trichomonas vaginalis G3]KAI5541616.1 guanylate cyclase protein [Trichomonas vaginalis G3]|eukprot:XP_001312380.1 hypothetical protein [Trichomonas vaginalis G3]
MEEVKTNTEISSQDFSGSMNSKITALIDVPISDKLIDSLVSLFNYMDIYAPKMPLLYSIVTILRLFQLIGCSMMAANNDVFDPTTLTYKSVSILSVLFHIVPVTYRRGNEPIILLSFNCILFAFGIYLILTACIYRATSKVPDISTYILSVFMAIGPFLILPIIAQYTGTSIGGLIMKRLHADTKLITAVIISCCMIAFYLWMIIKSYTSTLSFRPCSFQTLEGMPQIKLFTTTILITFFSAFTTYLDEMPSLGMSVVSIILYAYNITTVFNCGTFVKTEH